MSEFPYIAWSRLCFLQTASGILCLRRIQDLKIFTGNETIPPPIMSNKTERHEGGEKVCGFFLKKETGQTKN